MQTSLTSAQTIALAYQQQSLHRVSRSFALTIPQLPQALQISVGNAYLLCRIADTIEDDIALSPEAKTDFNQQFLAVLNQQQAIKAFTAAIVPALADETSEAELDLLAETEKVLCITNSLSAVQQQALIRCVQIMSEGMAEFQRQQELRGFQGLATSEDLGQYCYYVAGVVGEMLCELFCDHSAEIQAQKAGLSARAVAFGQGLQMTNILKDIWDDRERGICWLPADVFSQAGFDLETLGTATCKAGEAHPAFRRGILSLVSLTVAQLDQALAYSLLIPRKERGIRRFCLWAIAMAVLTLRNIAKQKGFYRPEQVKISRHQVRLVVLLSYFWIGNDKRIEQLYQHWTAPLRKISIDATTSTSLP